MQLHIIPDKAVNEKRAILNAHTSPPLANADHTMPYVYPIVKTQKAKLDSTSFVWFCEARELSD